jgi:hypothetical protein
MYRVLMDARTVRVVEYAHVIFAESVKDYLMLHSQPGVAAEASFRSGEYDSLVFPLVGECVGMATDTAIGNPVPPTSLVQALPDASEDLSHGDDQVDLPAELIPIIDPRLLSDGVGHINPVQDRGFDPVTIPDTAQYPRGIHKPFIRFNLTGYDQRVVVISPERITYEEAKLQELSHIDAIRDIRVGKLLPNQTAFGCIWPRSQFQSSTEAKTRDYSDCFMQVPAILYDARRMDKLLLQMASVFSIVAHPSPTCIEVPFGVMLNDEEVLESLEHMDIVVESDLGVSGVLRRASFYFYAIGLHHCVFLLQSRIVAIDQCLLRDCTESFCEIGFAPSLPVPGYGSDAAVCLAVVQSKLFGFKSRYVEVNFRLAKERIKLG